MNPMTQKLKGSINAAISHVALSLCYFFSLFPAWVLYLISDVFSVLLRSVVKYRRKVVRENLSHSFPEKTPQEIKSIEKKFYNHLMDVFVEYLILIRSNARILGKYITYENLELLDRLYKSGKDVALIMGHYGNWEFLSHLALQTKYSYCPVYKRQQNAYFDQFLIKLRSKYGALPVEMQNAFRHVCRNKQKGMRTILLLIADQCPVNAQYFIHFLNHEGTSVYEGPEKIASALDMAVVFGDVKKKSRGRYSMEFVLLHENPKHLEKGEITEMHVRYLEKKIQEKPEYWLWSHRRWKRTKPTDQG